MWFIQFFYPDIWRILCFSVLEQEQQEKKNIMWLTISKPQYPFHVICSFVVALLCHTSLWHLSQRVSGWYSANYSLNAKYFCSALLIGATTDWRTIPRPGIWCLDSYLNTLFSVKYDLLSITFPKCLSLLLPEELRFFFFFFFCKHFLSATTPSDVKGFRFTVFSLLPWSMTSLPGLSYFFKDIKFSVGSHEVD